MNKLDTRRLALTLVVGMAALLLLSSCQIWGQDPFQAGQAFRRQVDQFIAESRQFLSGFCSGGMAPAALVFLSVWLLRRQVGS